jgi:hypothetical protein
MGNVPDTYTFSLQDVVDVVEPVGVNTLQACFDAAADSNFDPAYKGDKNSLRNFRNYGFTGVACDDDISVTQTENYYDPPYEIEITLGSNTGTVNVEFRGRNLPDMLLVYYDGNLVLNTGYQGNVGWYGYNGSFRYLFTNSLYGKSDPLSESNPKQTFPYVNTPFPDHIEPDGYPKVSGGTGWQYFSFLKTTTQPTKATVKVYAPAEGTAFDFKIKCPE